MTLQADRFNKMGIIAAAVNGDTYTKQLHNASIQP
jgi:hypothetical protein